MSDLPSEPVSLVCKHTRRFPFTRRNSISRQRPAAATAGRAAAGPFHYSSARIRIAIVSSVGKFRRRFRALSLFLSCFCSSTQKQSPNSKRKEGETEREGGRENLGDEEGRVSICKLTCNVRRKSAGASSHTYTRMYAHARGHTPTLLPGSLFLLDRVLAFDVANTS